MLGKWIFTVFIVSLVLLSAGSILPARGVDEAKTGVIVGFKDKPTATDIGFLKSQGADIKYAYDIIPAVAVALPPQAIENIMKMCQKGTSNVPFCTSMSYMEPDAEVHLVAKSAPMQPSQTIPWGISRINADASWSISNGSNVKIAVLDTGIDYSHPDLDANVKGGVTFAGTRDYNDDNGHGTHVAGTIAAENNNIGVVGVAPSAQLYGVKVLNRFGSGSLSSVIAGIDWSVTNGMHVITMSLGTNTDSQALKTAVDRAYNGGIVVVAAAGNNNGAIIYPAGYDSVIAVTATDSSNTKASFSSFGSQAKLAAPGVDIYSTYKGGRYTTMSGTSMATPHVTGTVALLLATTIPSAYDADMDGVWDPPEIRLRLYDTATDLGATGWDQYYGYGLVNAYKAVNIVS